MTAYMPEAKSVEWYTPPKLYASATRGYDIDVDVCAKNALAAKVPRFFSPEQDGLKQDWSGLTCWMNPPYGRAIVPWVEKAADHKVIALLPARTDTAWFHDYVDGWARIIFIRGRVRFLNEAGVEMAPAPFPCMLAYWNLD